MARLLTPRWLARHLLVLGVVAEPAIAHLLHPVFALLHVPQALVHPIAFVLHLAHA